MKQFDVFAYGMISSSRLYILKSGFPKADHYVEIESSYKMIGGEAANSSIVLSVLGLKVKIDGNWLNQDERGRDTKRILNNFRIETSRIKFKKGNICPDEVVFSDQKTRTIFGNYGTFLSNRAKWNIPQKDDILKAKIVCLDPFFHKESLLVAKYAQQLNIPYVTVDCKYSDWILNNSLVTIISTEFISRTYGKWNKEKLFKKYLEKSKGLIIFTSGNKKIIFGRKNGQVHYYKPDKIKPIDTAGAGDSFRAGIIFGSLQGWEDDKMIAFSSTLASLVCLRFPGVLNCPKLREVINYMKKF